MGRKVDGMVRMQGSGQGDGLRSRLRRGARVNGLWYITPSPSFLEIARSFPLDMIVFDMEHGLLGMADLVESLRILRGTAIDLVVRIPSHDETMIGRVLDRGARGVVVPRVDDAATAARMGAAARFPPTGRRGLAIGALRAADYGQDAGYRAGADDGCVVMVQLESGRAIEDAVAIGTAPGIDAAFIGPGDLGADLGLEGPANHADLAARIDATLVRLARAGVPVATVPHCGREPAELFGLGFACVVHGSDIIMMQEGLARYCAGIATPAAG
jgi:2-keto-3-deoxy-L-rhamnonate aldolase RhmA